MPELCQGPVLDLLLILWSFTGRTDIWFNSVQSCLTDKINVILRRLIFIHITQHSIGIGCSYYRPELPHLSP